MKASKKTKSGLPPYASGEYMKLLETLTNSVKGDKASGPLIKKIKRLYKGTKEKGSITVQIPYEILVCWETDTIPTDDVYSRCDMDTIDFITESKKVQAQVKTMMLEMQIKIDEAIRKSEALIRAHAEKLSVDLDDITLDHVWQDVFND